MDALLLTVYLVLAAVTILQGVLVAVQTLEHRRFAGSRLGNLPSCPRKGRVVLIVPCRGAETDLGENLASVLSQDYGNYEVRFVVESIRDPAYGVIRRTIAAHPEVQARVIVAGRSTTSGQKVHNLLAATEDLPPEAEYLAFADSDARLRPEWLRALLSHLDDPGVGAATGYRWFIPKRSTLADHLVYSLNSSIAVFLGKHPPTVVWGGSWAIRRERFESLGLRDAWEGMLDEDLVAGRVFRDAGLRVRFEPACMVTSGIDGSPQDLFSFARRQYLLTRFYSRTAWRLILLSTTIVSLTFWGGLALAAWGWISGSSLAWLPATVSVTIYLLSVTSGWIRQAAAAVYFPDLDRELQSARRFEIWSGPLVVSVNWIVVVASAFGKQIRWRGIGYRLRSDGRILRVDRGESGLSGPHWRWREGRSPDEVLGPADRQGRADWSDAKLVKPAAM